MSTFRITGTYFEDENFTTRARITSSTGAVLDDGDFSAWDLRVYDDDSATPNTPIYESLANTVDGTYILAALSTTGWTKDSTGYNFSHPVEHQGATGTIDILLEPSDSDQVVISDGTTSVTYIFLAAGGIDTEDKRYLVTGGSAANAAANLITEINDTSVFAAPTITASVGTGGTNPIDLLNDVVGTDGNTTITENTSGVRISVTTQMLTGDGFPTKGGHTYILEYRLVPATVTDGITRIRAEYAVASSRDR